MKKHLKILFLFLFILFINQEKVLSDNKIDSLIVSIENQKNDTTKINTLIQLSELLIDQEDYDSAYFYIETALNIANKIKEPKYFAKTIGAKGRLYRYEGRFKESLNYLKEAYELANNINDKRLLMNLANSLGVTYRRLIEDDKALNYHLQAYKLAEELNDLRNLGIASNSIGIIYTWQKQYDQALPYYEKAKSISEQTNNSTGIAINLNSIAWVYELKKDYQNAIKYYKQSIEVNIKANNIKGVAICNNDLGKVYRTIGEYSQSLSYYKKALEVNTAIGDKRYIATSNIYIGEVYKDIGDLETSLSHLSVGLEYAQEIGEKRLLQMAWEQFSIIYEKLNKNKLALEAYKKSSAYKDTILDEEKAKQIIEMQTRYETERKENEIRVLNSEKVVKEIQLKNSRLGLISVILITLLLLVLSIIQYRQYHNRKKINAILNVKNKQLRQFISAKDRFISIVAHDLKGPLSAFIGLIEILKENLRENKIEESKDVLNVLYDSSKKINDMLLSLLEWAQIQQDKKTLDTELVNLNDIVTQTILLINEMAKVKAIKIINNIDNNIELHTSKNGLFTIFNNLISNGIKFSSDNGQVIINADINDDKVIISVEDQGIGIAEKDIHKLFKIEEDTREIGKSKFKGTGMGLIICKELIEKMNGDIWVESELSKGSKFIFTLPNK